MFTALNLQELPVAGPLLITPMVTLVNDIPIVSDLLHPLFGYPATPDGVAPPRDVWVMSADGTQIDVHFMPASGLLVGQTAPTVFVGSGLGLPGATNMNASPLDGVLADFFGLVGAATLRNAGYNVVTWDPRGEYSSGGSIQLDSADFEACDVSAIINWVAAQPETQLDCAGDPRMGMVGPSYGGGIQLVTAATDHRVDAIVPTIAWNRFTDALYPNGAFKSGWGTLLEGVLLLTLARVNPRILPAVIYADLTGKITPEDLLLMAQRGPGPVKGFPDLVSRITAPTLLIQGTVDTLLSLKEADLTAASPVAQGVPTKMLWFCAVDLETPDSTITTYIVGEPQISLSYSGTGTGDHVYAQLVDNTTGLVLGNQVTPIPVTLDGQDHTASVPLAPVAQTLRPGETVTLQVFAWSADFASSSSLGSLTVNELRLSLPTYDPSAPESVSTARW